MSYGGDSVGEPPQQPPHRLDSVCKSAPPPKRRDIFRGINLEKVWQANGKMPLSIALMQMIGNNAKYFTRLVENQVRFTMSPCYPSWTKVLEEQRAPLRNIIEEQSSKIRPIGGKATYLSVQGLKSFYAMRYDEDKLVESRKTQQTQVVSSGVLLDERAIAKEVHEER
ncbi:Uncharacterized protein Adt_28241 [Abeliophyllum distichum]|uniref:Uncharacterized protein n=1 Tax=Abeliophyllum distichum TaxID=126358 RepID=A0ABD1RWD8_9LAMI